MLAMDVWCFSKSTIRVDLEKHQTRLHYWGNSLCNFEESPLQLWGILLYNKHNTEEFASAIRNSDNYFVLITRENLYNLPYSVEEIYGMHSSGKYQNTKKVCQLREKDFL